MTFHPVYYSQQDPTWKDDIVGFGEAGDTIGYVGCALTSTAMLLSGHGYHETPKLLNEKLRVVDGFAGAGIHWGTVSKIHPQVTVKSNISCVNTDAPFGQIDASIAAGQPVIVMVDSTPAAGLLTHWVLLYAREGDDYLMLDPWPYQTNLKKKTFLMPRYSQGNPLRRSIMHVIIYECFSAGGGITSPADASASTSTTPRNRKAHAAPTHAGPYARVKTDITWGLNIRSSNDTTSTANIVTTVPAGSFLTLLEADGTSKVGAVNQWVRVRDDKGFEGFAAAWYLEKGQPAAPAPQTAPRPAPAAVPAIEMPVPTTTTSPSTEKQKLFVVVKSAGAKVFKDPSAKSEVLSKEKGGAKLAVVEPLETALPKIGLAGKWLTIRGTNNKRGYVDGGLVKEG